MRTTTLARDGLYRWRGMDAGHRGRAVAIEVGMQVGIQVLFAGLVVAGSKGPRGPELFGEFLLAQAT